MRSLIFKSRIFLTIFIFYGSLDCMHETHIRWRRRTNYKKTFNIQQSYKNAIQKLKKLYKNNKDRMVALCEEMQKINAEKEELLLKIGELSSESEKLIGETEFMKLATDQKIREINEIHVIAEKMFPHIHKKDEDFLDKLYSGLKNKIPLEKINDLLKQGKYVNIPYSFDDDNKIPSMHMNALHAALYHELPLEYILLLCKYKANVNMIFFGSKETPCHSIIRNFSKPSMPEIMRILMAHGADLSIEDNKGNTVFHRVAQHGNFDACYLLTEQEHKAIKTFLLINKRNNKKYWVVPKPVMKLILNVTFPYSGTYTENYIYKKRLSLKAILEKKNKKAKRAYDIACGSQNYNKQNLMILEQYREENFLFGVIDQGLIAVNQQITKTEKIINLLDSGNY